MIMLDFNLLLCYAVHAGTHKMKAGQSWHIL